MLKMWNSREYLQILKLAEYEYYNLLFFILCFLEQRKFFGIHRHQTPPRYRNAASGSRLKVQPSTHQVWPNVMSFIKPEVVFVVTYIAELARGEKSHTHSVTHPAYLMCREPKVSLRNKMFRKIVMSDIWKYIVTNDDESHAVEPSSDKCQQPHQQCKLTQTDRQTDGLQGVFSNKPQFICRRMTLNQSAIKTTVHTVHSSSPDAHYYY